MSLADLIPVVAILSSASVVIAVLHFHYERAKLKAYGAGSSAEGTQESARLVHENELLTATVERLEDRIAVLERIATDPAERTSREIERLRHGAE